jgi:hypothetical protein
MAGSSRADGVIVRFRNRDILPADLEFLREVIVERGSRGPVEVSRVVCEAWNWRQANGELATFACRDLVLRLAEWGLVSRPARPRADRSAYDRRRDRRLPILAPDLVTLTGLSVRGGNLDQLVVRPITPEERLGWRLYVERYHYLGYRVVVGEHLLYAAFLDGELVGLLSWASAAFRAPLRERFIGWDETTRRQRLHFVVNNGRFLLLPWVRVKNLASRVLALNLRRLSDDWRSVWRHPVLLAETFVDTTRFRGTCYRASNWIHLGETAGRTKRGYEYPHIPKTGVAPKALYVYPLRRHACRWLREGIEDNA